VNVALYVRKKGYGCEKKHRYIKFFDWPNRSYKTFHAYCNIRMWTSSRRIF